MNFKGGNISISNGKISSTAEKSSTIHNEGTISITGGTISSANYYAIYNQGTATVSGANIIGKVYGV